MTRDMRKLTYRMVMIHLISLYFAQKFINDKNITAFTDEAIAYENVKIGTRILSTKALERVYRSICKKASFTGLAFRLFSEVSS